MSKDEADKLIAPQTMQGYVVPLDIRCGHCYHHKRSRAKRYADVCANLGVLESGRPCRAFSLDGKLVNLKTSEGKEFADFIRQVPSTKLTTLAALLQHEKTTRRYGFQHGEEVFIRMYQDEYLSNYARAWVIMANSKRVFLQGKNHRFRAELMIGSVFDAERFKTKRHKLIQQNRITDPKLSTYQTVKRPVPKVLDNYVVPTLDEFVKMETKSPNKIKKPKLKSHKKGNKISVIQLRHG